MHWRGILLKNLNISESLMARSRGNEYFNCVRNYSYSIKIRYLHIHIWGLRTLCKKEVDTFLNFWLYTQKKPVEILGTRKTSSFLHKSGSAFTVGRFLFLEISTVFQGASDGEIYFFFVSPLKPQRSLKNLDPNREYEQRHSCGGQSLTPVTWKTERRERETECPHACPSTRIRVLC